MPIADGFLGTYFGMFADKYGIQWMADFQNKTGKVTDEKPRMPNIGFYETP